MTAATRKTATVANGGDRSGSNYLSGVDTEIEALWKSSHDWLINVAGTGDSITCTTDTALVAAITAWARPMSCIYVPIHANTTAVVLNRDSVGNINVKDKFGAALQGGEFAIGGCYPLFFDGTNLIAVTVSAGASSTLSTAPDVIVEDQKSSTTAGGTFASGSYLKRDLTQLVRNVNTLAGLSSSQITLPAGTYYIRASTPAKNVDRHKARFRNVTDSSDIAYGTSEFSDSGTAQYTTTSTLEAVFTITSSKTFELQHRCSTTHNTVGFGDSTSFGNIEVYSRVSIWKQ